MQIICRDEKAQLLVGVRRANRQAPTLPSSVLSTDSMHIGVLAAAAHAASSKSPFTIYYNPRSVQLLLQDFFLANNKYLTILAIIPSIHNNLQSA
jgi:hypothetical protein